MRRTCARRLAREPCRDLATPTGSKLVSDPLVSARPIVPLGGAVDHRVRPRPGLQIDTGRRRRRPARIGVADPSSRPASGSTVEADRKVAASAPTRARTLDARLHPSTPEGRCTLQEPVADCTAAATQPRPERQAALLQGLTAEQAHAVTYGAGPVLIITGGAGVEHTQEPRWADQRGVQGSLGRLRRRTRQRRAAPARRARASSSQSYGRRWRRSSPMARSWRSHASSGRCARSVSARSRPTAATRPASGASAPPT